MSRGQNEINISRKLTGAGNCWYVYVMQIIGMLGNRDCMMVNAMLKLLGALIRSEPWDT